MAVEKSCQESKGKQERDVLNITVITAVLTLAYIGSPEAGKMVPPGIVLSEQLGKPWLVDLRVPTSG